MFRDAGPGDGATIDAFDPYVEVARVPVVVNRDLDLLFVIDDAPASLSLQNALKAGFPNLVNVLNTIEGGLPNLHLGVVSPDLGTKGAQDNLPGPDVGTGAGSCSGDGKSGNLQTNNTSLVNGNFINDQRNSDGTRTRNIAVTLSSAFDALASLGEQGCAYGQPVEAARRALNNNPANAGFLRPNAHKAIVFVSAFDDCSMAHSTLLGSDTTTLGPLNPFRCVRFGVTCDVGGTSSSEMATPGAKSGCHWAPTSPYLTSLATYKTFFDSIAGGGDVYVSALAGPLTPYEVVSGPFVAGTCPSTPAMLPGTRLADLAASFEWRRVQSACGGDLSEPLVQLGLDLRRMIGTACIGYNLVTPLDCHAYRTTGGTTTELPACPTSGGTDCWRIVQDQQVCPVNSGFKLDVPLASAPAVDTVFSLRCLVQ